MQDTLETSAGYCSWYPALTATQQHDFTWCIPRRPAIHQAIFAVKSHSRALATFQNFGKVRKLVYMHKAS